MESLGCGFRGRLLFIFASFFLFSYVHSLPIPKTSILNVSATVKKASEFLSFNKKSFETRYQELQNQQNNSSFSVKLYSRDTLLPKQFKTYRDLTLARLARHSARVKFISKKLNLALQDNQLETPVSRGTGAYFARIGIGMPSKQFNVAIDTGSDITWTQCERCTVCFEQTDPKFDPAISSSFKPLSCDSQQCQQLDTRNCIADTCNYHVGYGDHSETTGDFATETLTIGNTAINDVAIGCGLDNHGTFDRDVSGLMGLGTGPLSFPSQIASKFFSYCLVHGDSTLAASTLEFGSAISSDAITVPLLHNNNSFYQISLTGISVGGAMFLITSKGGDPGLPLIVDSGTTITQLPSNIYSQIRDEFAKGINFAPAAGVPPFDTCFYVPSQEAVIVPSVALHFGDKSIILPPQNYFVLVALNPITVCFAFKASEFQIMGNVQQQGFRVSFDLQNSVVGFAPDQC